MLRWDDEMICCESGSFSAKLKREVVHETCAVLKSVLVDDVLEQSWHQKSTKLWYWFQRVLLQSYEVWRNLVSRNYPRTHIMKIYIRAHTQIFYIGKRRFLKSHLNGVFTSIRWPSSIPSTRRAWKAIFVFYRWSILVSWNVHPWKLRWQWEIQKIDHAFPMSSYWTWKFSNVMMLVSWLMYLLRF